MRKIPFLLLLLLAFFFTGLAQRKVHLLVTYLPNHSYEQKMDQMSNMEIEFKVDSAEMKEIPGGGKPVKKTSSMHVETETKTGKLFKDSMFSEKMVINSLTTSAGSSVIPAGTILYGTGTTSGRITMDSLSSDSMDSEVKEKLFPILQKVFKQISIPERNLKVGETFSHQLPYSFPVPGTGMNLSFVINTTYKLKNISGDLAYFDLEQTYTMNSESVTMPITATGTGTGTMIYDLNNNYFSRYELNNTMNIELTIEQKSMKAKAESTTIQQVKIRAN